MSRRTIFLVLGVVILVQVLFFNYFQTEQNFVLDKARENLKVRFDQLEGEKADLIRKHRQLSSGTESSAPQLISLASEQR